MKIKNEKVRDIFKEILNQQARQKLIVVLLILGTLHFARIDFIIDDPIGYATNHIKKKI